MTPQPQTQIMKLCRTLWTLLQIIMILCTFPIWLPGCALWDWQRTAARKRREARVERIRARWRRQLETERARQEYEQACALEEAEQKQAQQQYRQRLCTLAGLHEGDVPRAVYVRRYGDKVLAAPLHLN